MHNTLIHKKQSAAYLLFKSQVLQVFQNVSCYLGHPVRHVLIHDFIPIYHHLLIRHDAGAYDVHTNCHLIIWSILIRRVD